MRLGLSQVRRIGHDTPFVIVVSFDYPFCCIVLRRNFLNIKYVQMFSHMSPPNDSIGDLVSPYFKTIFPIEAFGNDSKVTLK